MKASSTERPQPRDDEGAAATGNREEMRADQQTGERIRQRREELGLSQRDLDEATSYSYAYVSRIESGARTPSLSAVIEFGAALDTSALWLATGRRTDCR